MSDVTRYRVSSRKLENAVGKSARDDGESYLTMVVLASAYDRDIQARDETIARLREKVAYYINEARYHASWHRASVQEFYEYRAALAEKEE